MASPAGLAQVVRYDVRTLDRLMKIFRQFRSRRGQQEEVGEVEFTGSYSVMEDVMVAEVTSAFKCEDDKEEEEKQAPVVPEAQQKIMTDEAHDQSTKSSTKAKTVKRVVSSILPHVEPLKWTTFVCLSFWCSIPAIIYILLFTVRNYTHHDGI